MQLKKIRVRKFSKSGKTFTEIYTENAKKSFISKPGKRQVIYTKGI